MELQVKIKIIMQHTNIPHSLGRTVSHAVEDPELSQ